MSKEIRPHIFIVCETLGELLNLSCKFSFVRQETSAKDIMSYQESLGQPDPWENVQHYALLEEHNSLSSPNIERRRIS